MTTVKNESGVITSVVLPVIVDGYKWECNKDRMWNLNELHKALSLDENQRPSEWDNKVSRELLSSGNLRKVIRLEPMRLSKPLLRMLCGSLSRSI
jgi:hypothetical protein